jgi:hypothetical protein
LVGDPTPILNQPSLPTTSTTTTSQPPTTTTTTVPPSTTSTTPAPGRPPRPYSVGFTNLDLTDATRGGRHLPTLVFYPAVGPGNGAETGGAQGLFRNWPLVVFAEGEGTTPLAYHDLLHHLAASGFVVAAPTFPVDTPADLANEPGDVRYVIDQVLAAAGRPGVLDGMVDASRIALVGHSEGGDAVLMEAYTTDTGDSRVGPVVAMAASGSIPASPKHDLLVIQGTADTVNQPNLGNALYASAPSPRAYLQLLGADHVQAYTAANQWRPVVEAAVVDWLDAWFGGPNAATAAGRLGHDANIPGTAQIQLG